MISLILNLRSYCLGRLLIEITDGLGLHHIICGFYLLKNVSEDAFWIEADYLIIDYSVLVVDNSKGERSGLYLIRAEGRIPCAIYLIHLEIPLLLLF